MNKKNWEKHYDKDCDHLFVGTYPMKEGNHLTRHLESTDVSLYIDNKGEINGIYIEYYKTDFVKRYKKFFKLFNKK